jgi:hypothetical protein
MQGQVSLYAWQKKQEHQRRNIERWTKVVGLEVEEVLVEPVDQVAPYVLVEAMQRVQQSSIVGDGSVVSTST